MSPDGRLVMTVGNGKVHVWDLRAGKHLHCLEDVPSGFPVTAIFHPEELLLMTGHSGGSITCWDGETFHETSTTASPSTCHGQMQLLTHSRTGKGLIAGYSDGICVYGMDPEIKLLRSTSVPWSNIADMTVTPDDSCLVNLSLDGGGAAVWNVDMTSCEWFSRQESSQASSIPSHFLMPNKSVSSTASRRRPALTATNPDVSSTSISSEESVEDMEVTMAAEAVPNVGHIDSSTRLHDLAGTAVMESDKQPSGRRVKSTTPHLDQIMNDPPSLPEPGTSSDSDTAKQPLKLASASNSWEMLDEQQISGALTEASNIPEAILEQVEMKSNSREKSLSETKVLEPVQGHQVEMEVMQDRSVTTEPPLSQNVQAEKTKTPPRSKPGSGECPMFIPTCASGRPVGINFHAFCARQPQRKPRVTFLPPDPNSILTASSFIQSTLQRRHSHILSFLERSSLKRALKQVPESSDVWHDILGWFETRQRLWNLDCCTLALSGIRVVLFDVFEDYVIRGAETAMMLAKLFSPVIAENLAAGVANGVVDIAREDRIRKCQDCHSEFKIVHEMLKELEASPGGVGKSVKEALAMFDQRF